MKAVDICKIIVHGIVAVCILCCSLPVGAAEPGESAEGSGRVVYDKGVCLRSMYIELLNAVNQLRDSSESEQDWQEQLAALAERLERWKELLAELDFATADQENKWKFTGNGYGDYRPCLYRHKGIQKQLDALRGKLTEEQRESAISGLESEIRDAEQDSDKAMRTANKMAARWIDAWLRARGGKSVESIVNAHRDAHNAAQLEAFMRMWRSGAPTPQKPYNINDKTECLMFILLSERANYAAAFGGSHGVFGYSRKYGVHAAHDYLKDISHEVDKHFVDDAGMTHFLVHRYTKDNAMTLFISVLEVLLEEEK